MTSIPDTTGAEFREAMAHLAAAVNVVTTAGPAGRGGFTASAVCSVTDNPPMLLVCMNRRSAQHRQFLRNRVLCVNTLSAEHQRLSLAFSGSPPMAPESRFALASWERLATGAPVLSDALVAFDCRIADTIDKGTHTIFFSEVLSIGWPSESTSALVYFERDYHPVNRIR